MEVRHPETVRWREDGPVVEILDQTRLPEEEVWLAHRGAAEVADSIRTLRVRGAPAIGVAAAWALALEAARLRGEPFEHVRSRLDEAADLLASTRPTAVNLFWAIERMRARLGALGAGEDPARALREEAAAVHREDREMCRRIGEHGLPLLMAEGGEVRILTHCNAGALATGGMGTALAPVYLAHAAGRRVHVYADETRPVLQGSRLTAWEMTRAGIPVTLIADTVAGHLMRQGKVDLVIVGADRIAANGDVANKIGTYALAVLARAHGIPFYVAAPTSTFDPATPTGEAIPIEERDPDEVRRGFGRLTAPADVPVYSPAFDVTPAELVTAIVTDRGVLRPPYDVSIKAMFAEDRIAAGV